MPLEIVYHQNAKLFNVKIRIVSIAKVFSSLKENYWANSRDFERIRGFFLFAKVRLKVRLIPFNCSTNSINSTRVIELIEISETKNFELTSDVRLIRFCSSTNSIKLVKLVELSENKRILSID